MKSFEIFDSFVKQFNDILEQRGKHLSRENFNYFFRNCCKYYSTIEHVVSEDISAFKILIRMVALLPLNRDNVIIGSEAARIFASIILKLFSTKFSMIWSAINDAEWASFRDGFVILCSLRLLHTQQATDKTDQIAHLLSLISDQEQRREIVLQLIDLLSDFQCSFSKNEEVTLYTLLDKNYLNLKHLEVVTSVETYINYLPQIMQNHQGELNQLEEDIQIQLDTLIRDKRLSSKRDFNF